MCIRDSGCPPRGSGVRSPLSPSAGLHQQGSISRAPSAGLQQQLTNISSPTSAHQHQRTTVGNDQQGTFCERPLLLSPPTSPGLVVFALPPPELPLLPELLPPELPLASTSSNGPPTPVATSNTRAAVVHAVAYAKTSGRPVRVPVSGRAQGFAPVPLSPPEFFTVKLRAETLSPVTTLPLAVA